MHTALRRSRSGKRLSVMLVCYLVLSLVMGYQLVHVQVVSASEYRELADRQLQRTVELPSTRGKLYDRAGEPLAMSLSAATVYADPGELAANDIEPADVAAELADVLDMPVEDLTERLGREASFVYLGRQLPREVGERVRDMTLPGVGVLSEPKRVYPGGALASQVVGFAGVDNEGLEGLEMAYDEALAGTSGSMSEERSPHGLEISHAGREIEPPEPGTDVVLTIDRQIQSTTERVLAQAMEQYQAEGASALVMDVETGEILAMASMPGFDPTDAGASDDYTRRNRAVTDVFEPGSVNKVITAAAALEEGLVSADEVFHVPDRITEGTGEFKDSSAHEPENWTFSDIIAQSSNVGTIKVAQRLDRETFHGYLSEFGMGRSAELGFPGEASGILPDHQDWWDTSRPTLAIGHGVAANLLQMAGVFETVASGGEWVQPSLVRGTVGRDGRLEPAPERERRRVVDTDTAEQLSQMLVGVITDGTGHRAAVPGYHVGGKTGTAQKPSPDGGYMENAYLATFAGFAPAEDPQLVVAVMLDEPSDYYGGESAAPVFSQIMDFALGHRRVLPSEPDERETTAPADADPRDLTDPGADDPTSEGEYDEAESQGVDESLPPDQVVDSPGP